MEDKERLQKQFDFVLELDKLKSVKRQSYVADGSRRENDAEHSWHLALMAMLFNEYANEQTDMLQVMKMVLIHDAVEIDAGDTYAYDEAGNATKRQREEKAADRIFSLLPEDQAGEMRELWEEFEANETPEARFANALDRVQPIMLNDWTGGKAWREHEVAASQVLDRNRNTHLGSEELWNYVKALVEKNRDLGNLKDA
ncbi:MAG: HD domain-containing protein [Bacteroidales bacterium]|nr:HD domain-containing protein [Clostridium sp.]MCM1204077.1 HD domain-containing protein [Bacteroidales bacterium]